MLGRRGLAGAIALTLLCTSMLLGAPATAATTGGISGNVSGPGGAIPGVEVSITNALTFETFYATTGPLGNYVRNNLPPGYYVVEFYPDPATGFIPEVYDDAASYEEATLVTVTADTTTTGINAVLEIGGSISGTVTAPPGAIDDGIVVFVGGETTDAFGLAFVESDGTFVVNALPSDTYLVQFGSFFDPTIRIEWYDNEWMVGAATAVEVTAPDATTGIDAALRRCLAPLSFTDVLMSNPFCLQIDWLVGEEITGGFLDGTYRPRNAITRGSLAAFLHRLEGSPAMPPLGPGECLFIDVCEGHLFAEPIAWMVSEELTTGYSDDTFRSGDPVSRQAMSAFIHRLVDEPSIGFVPTEDDCLFIDVCGDHPFAVPIFWMALEGIAGGYEDGSFKPGSKVTRQGMAGFLFNFESIRQLYERFGIPWGFDPLGAARGDSPDDRLEQLRKERLLERLGGRANS
jgi:hypothetical protein